jgi:hypothetical protein
MTFKDLRQDPVVVVAAWSGLAGFVLGAFAYGTWQVAVESAQVVAGIVEYPRDNPFYLYHTKLWTLAHQVPAVLLLAGLGERAVSLLLSGVLGMISFQALALSVLAVSGDKLLAIGTPFFIEYSRATMFWIAYPVWLLGTSHTYGVLGLSAALLVVALFANGRHRAGAVALGLMPAIHPSIAAWLFLLAAATAAWHFGRNPAVLRPLVRPFLAGAALAALSLGVHMLVTYDVPAIAPEVASRYFLAYVRAWDGHRRPLSFDQPGVVVALGAAVLAALWIFAFRARPDARFLLRFIVACGILGVALVCVSWVPIDRIPEKLLVLMPNRLLNLNVLMGVALLVALLGTERHLAFRANLAALLALGAWLPEKVGVSYWRDNPSVHPGFYVVQWPAGWPLRVLGLSAVALALAAVFVSRRRAAKPAREGSATAASVFRAIAWSALAWTAIGLVSRVPRGQAGEAELRDFRNDRFLARVSEGRGLLLTAADLHLIQLRTRRPVLMDGGAVDTLTYAIAGGPKLEEILRRAYGVDLFRPPAEVAASGTIPRNYTRAIWRSRTAAEWADIGRELGVTHVLTYPDWSLQLPLVDRNDEFAYYSVE